MIRASVLLLAVWPLAGQTNEALIEQIREHAISTLFQQPNYTCLETIHRRHEGSQKVEDTLRVEVALVDGKEMFGWPGASGFQDAEAGELARSGSFSSGNFGLYPRLIFYGDDAKFTLKGETGIDSRRVIQYDFVVPQAVSGFHLAKAGQDVAVGFHGSIFIDAKSLDLVRLQITADAIPAVIEISAAEDVVDYARVPFGDGSILLPRESRSRVATPKFTDYNRVVFSKCKRFGGESRLIFEEPTEAAPTDAPAVQNATLPAGKDIKVTVEDIDLEEAAVGDAVRAVASSKGPTISARIMRLDRYAKEYRVVLRFDHMEVRGDQELVIPRGSKRKLTGLTLSLRVLP